MPSRREHAAVNCQIEVNDARLQTATGEVEARTVAALAESLAE